MEVGVIRTLLGEAKDEVSNAFRLNHKYIYIKEQLDIFAKRSLFHFVISNNGKK